MVLTFTLPSDYPSVQPPFYSVSCQWLSNDQVVLNNLVAFSYLTFNFQPKATYHLPKFQPTVEGLEFEATMSISSMLFWVVNNN